MRVVFLDIDGVLNYEKSKSYKDNLYLGIDTIRAKRLAKIVEATDAKIVLTSTWREFFAIGKTKWEQPSQTGRYLYNKLRRQHLFVYGKTTEKIAWKYRGHGIQKWLNEHPEVTDFVILDDELFTDYYELGYIDRVIKTIYHTDIDDFGGLTENLVYSAINILNKGPISGQGPVMDPDFIRFWKAENFRTPDKHDLFRI